MKPEIIIFAEGGMIQGISSNVPIKVYNLDRDIFECDLEEREFFSDRTYPCDVEKNWEKFKKKIADEWDKDMKDHPSFNHGDD